MDKTRSQDKTTDRNDPIKVVFLEKCEAQHSRIPFINPNPFNGQVVYEKTKSP